MPSHCNQVTWKITNISLDKSIEITELLIPFWNIFYQFFHNYPSSLHSECCFGKFQFHYSFPLLPEWLVVRAMFQRLTMSLLARAVVTVLTMYSLVPSLHSTTYVQTRSDQPAPSTLHCIKTGIANNVKRKKKRPGVSIRLGIVLSLFFHKRRTRGQNPK